MGGGDAAGARAAARRGTGGVPLGVVAELAVGHLLGQAGGWRGRAPPTAGWRIVASAPRSVPRARPGRRPGPAGAAWPGRTARWSSWVPPSWSSCRPPTSWWSSGAPRRCRRTRRPRRPRGRPRRGRPPRGRDDDVARRLNLLRRRMLPRVAAARCARHPVDPVAVERVSPLRKVSYPFVMVGGMSVVELLPASPPSSGRGRRRKRRRGGSRRARRWRSWARSTRRWPGWWPRCGTSWRSRGGKVSASARPSTGCAGRPASPVPGPRAWSPSPAAPPNSPELLGSVRGGPVGGGRHGPHRPPGPGCP